MIDQNMSMRATEPVLSSLPDANQLLGGELGILMNDALMQTTNTGVLLYMTAETLKRVPIPGLGSMLRSTIHGCFFTTLQ